MKKIFAMFLAAAVATAMCFSVYAANAPDGKGEAIYGIPVIDGTADDIWSDASEYDCNLIYDESDGTGADGRVKLMWSEDYFYAFVTVEDKTPFHNSDTPYHNDCVEICVDLDNSKGDWFDEIDDSQIRIQSTGVIDGLYGDLYYEDDIVFAVGFINGTDLSAGYTLEVAVPAKGYMEAGKKVGFDLQVVDDETGDGVSSQKGFYDTSDNIWQNPSLFGEITLLAPAPVVEPTAEPVVETPMAPVDEPSTTESAEPVIDTPDTSKDVGTGTPAADISTGVETGTSAEPSKTGDPASAALIITAIAAAASAAISKKRG